MMQTAFSGQAHSVPKYPGIRFSGKNTFVIPDGSDIFAIPGMFGPKATVTGITDYFSRNGHPRRVRSVKVPGIGTAQSFRISTDWLRNKIDESRIESAQGNLRKLYSKLDQVGDDEEKQIRVIKAFLKLDNSYRASVIAQGIRKVLLESQYPRRVLALNPEGNNKQTLASILSECRRQFLQTLPWDTSGDQSQKIANRVIDHIAPRMVIVGHSLGGLIGLNTMLERHADDLGLVISLGSPISGKKRVPKSIDEAFKKLDVIVPRPLQKPYRELIHHVLGTIYPAIPQMDKHSENIQKIRNTPNPFDTSTISISSPSDGLVEPDDAAHDDNQKGRLNLVVTPRKSSVSYQLESFKEDPLRHPKARALVKYAEPMLKVFNNIFKKTQLHDGLSHHLGLVEHWDDYWSDQGEFVQKLFDGAEAPERLKKLLDYHNYEPMREDILKRLIEKTRQTDKSGQKYQELYQPLIPTLESISETALPFEGSSDKLAKELLKLLKRP